MSELELLTQQKLAWTKRYEGFTRILCDAVLSIGEPDDMGNKHSIELHKMIVRSVSQGNVKIIATEKASEFSPAEGNFTFIRRLIVKVSTEKPVMISNKATHIHAEIMQPVYMTFGNSKDAQVDRANHNVIVPGEWMDYAQSVIDEYDHKMQEIENARDTKAIAELKKQMLVDVPGYGSDYKEGGHS